MEENKFNSFKNKDKESFYFNAPENSTQQIKDIKESPSDDKFTSASVEKYTVKETDSLINTQREKAKTPKKSRPKSEPLEPLSIVPAILVGIIYVAAAVLCYLCLKTDIISGFFAGFDSFDEISARALAELYGYMIIVLLPSILLVVANKLPISMTTGTRVLLWFGGVLGMAGLTVLFFFISARPEYKDVLGETVKDIYGISWQRGSTIVAVLGVISVHILGNIDPIFNTDNKFLDFVEIVCDFIQGQIMFIIYMILVFGSLGFPYLIMPIAGIVALAFIILLFVYLFNLSSD